MKVTKREKIILIMLAFIGIGVVYYQFVYTKQVAKLEEIRAQEAEVNNTYTTMLSKVNGIDKNKSSIKIFRESIGAKSMSLYPKLYQDKIILELNSLLNEAGIKGNISFTEVAVQTIEEYFAAGKEEAQEPSLKQTSDEINELNGKKTEKEEETSKEEVVPATPEEPAAGTEGETSEQLQGQEGLLVEQMKVTISFSGTYKNTTKFIELVSDYARLLAIPDITLAASGEDKVSGSLSLEFYSIPKISEEDAEYLKWELFNPYGKENPFLEGGTGITQSSSNEEDGYDLIMSVKGANSDLPSITLGKANDSNRGTYVYYDGNDKIDIDIEISEENGKYYVKYKTPDSSYPSNYEGKGIEVKPGDGKIEIGIYSSSRLSVDDKVAVNLNVTSTTEEKITVVTIMDEDKASPRIDITPVGKVEYVIK